MATTPTQPTKPTKSTKIVSESIKSTNTELLRQMIQLSNNSQLTNQTANLLSNKLEKEDMSLLMQWMYHANRENNHKQQSNKNLGFGNPNFKRY